MSILVAVLRDISNVKSMSIIDWQTLIEEARTANLLGRVEYLIREAQLSEMIPREANWHFNAARLVSESQRKHTLREIDEIKNAISIDNIEAIFLKGSAYQVAGYKCHYGRLQSDIDVLVNKNDIKTAEFSLLKAGWVGTSIDDYDEKYYRTWMHEIPPLAHVSRQTVVDLHHNILPLTNKDVIDPQDLVIEQREHPWCGRVSVLSEFDLIIHSSVHLFTESEFPNGLRDLSDLDLLLKEICNTEEKYFALIERAQALNLSHYIFLAFRYTQIILFTPIPDSVWKIISGIKWSILKSIVMDVSFKIAFTPHSKTNNHWYSFIFIWGLYLRGHMLRMPLRLLIPHLLKKGWMRLTERNEAKEQNLIP